MVKGEEVDEIDERWSREACERHEETGGKREGSDNSRCPGLVVIIRRHEVNVTIKYVYISTIICAQKEFHPEIGSLNGSIY